MDKIVNGVRVAMSPDEEAAFWTESSAGALRAPPVVLPTIAEIVSVLSVEQKAALAAMIAQRTAKRG